ncbi:Protein of unknown function [Solimonas aquatica]|uniref:DUF3108 domain-containing protein n=2 Tax=Solimonas aquatica TaxID=489703 RepID=A0A1H9IHM0_9GAMM|nr:Protein of unknown function [Solimonas aquatica]
MKCMSKLLALLLLGIGAAQAAAPEQDWTPHQERYSVAWGGIALGEGSISLKPRGADCFDYVSQTTPIALVRWSYGEPREASRFCVKDGAIVPQHFEYTVSGNSKDNFTLDFSEDGRRIKRLQGGTVTELSVTPPVYDRFVVREAIRIWAMQHAGEIGAEQEFTVLETGQPKTYRYAIKAREKVQTEAGSFDSIRVERVDNPKKIQRYWIAPSRHYAVVRVEHLYKGKQQLMMSLRP